MIMGKNFLTELRAQLLSSGNKEMANRQTMERRKCNVMMVTGDADKGTHTGEIYYDGDNSNKTINATSFFHLFPNCSSLNTFAECIIIVDIIISVCFVVHVHFLTCTLLCC